MAARPLVLSKRGKVLADVELATRLPDRMRGLLGREGLPEGRALCIVPCNSIHTWFMRFAIDVYFVDLEWRVVRCCRRVRPFRMAWGGRTAHAVLEMQSGWLPSNALQPGDRLSLDRERSSHVGRQDRR